jgi:GNAT superfamily N-acetyltransferase
MHQARRLNLGEGQLYRNLRLEALRESPAAFLTTYQSALQRDDASWSLQADSAAQGNDRAIFIAMEARPMGLAALYRDPADHSVGELLQMWVAPSHRRRGAATALLDFLMQWAARHAFTSIRAELTPGNLGARQFYLKYGFRALSRDSDEILLVKAI